MQTNARSTLEKRFRVCWEGSGLPRSLFQSNRKIRIGSWKCDRKFNAIRGTRKCSSGTFRNREIEKRRLPKGIRLLTPWKSVDGKPQEWERASQPSVSEELRTPSRTMNKSRRYRTVTHNPKSSDVWLGSMLISKVNWMLPSQIKRLNGFRQRQSNQRW